MSIETMQGAHQLPIQENLRVGIDVGGTKTDIVDTLSSVVMRFDTASYGCLDDVIDEYCRAKGARPDKVFVGWAGPRNDDTGEMELTNGDWPNFNPHDAAVKYGIEFETALDMVTIAEGVLHTTSIDLAPLKAGTPTRTGTKLVAAISTGVGSAAITYSRRFERYDAVVDGLGGHAGFQPKNDNEHEYLRYLLTQNPHASTERALSGKHGIDNMIDHWLDDKEAPHLATAIKGARQENRRAEEEVRPVGAVLLDFATQGKGRDHVVAQSILRNMGAMLGSVLRDWTLNYHATGGVYLTGSVALALGEYLAQNTGMNDRFVISGPEKDTWLEAVPINLVTDPHIAVIGALALAKEM
jgi:glucokinase